MAADAHGSEEWLLQLQYTPHWRRGHFRRIRHGEGVLTVIGGPQGTATAGLRCAR